MRIIPTALLSFGMSGRVFHAPFIELHPGFHLQGVWERTKTESRTFYQDLHIYRTLEEVLDDPIVELVVVNTPTGTHYEYTKKALEAGKHVVVEKAFTSTLAEAIELQELATSKKLMLSVFQNRRWDSDFSTIRQVIHSGVLGPITEAEFHYDRYREELSPKIHKEIPGPGAGLLIDLGPHLIDQAISLFGMPESVFGDIRILRPTSVVDDAFMIILFYKDKRVTLKSNLLIREALPAFVVHGIKGSFIKTRADVQETALLANEKPNNTIWGTEPESEQGLLHTESNGNIIKELIPTLQGNYCHYYAGIYDAITQGTQVPVSAEDGVNVMRIIEAVRESNQLKRLVSL